MRKQFSRSEGQSIIIVALALVVLVALLALVVDAGNAYVQRRKIQNAIDAGSQAGSIALGQSQNEGQIKTAAQKFVQSNGGPANASVHYVLQNNDLSYSNSNCTLPCVSSAWTPHNQTLASEGNLPIVGVNAQATNQFPSYFAGVLQGWRTMQVSAGGSTMVNQGICKTDTLFPIAVAALSFASTGGKVTLDPYTYPLIQNSAVVTQSNKFGYVSWNGTTGSAQFNSNASNWTSNVSGMWSDNDSVTDANATGSPVDMAHVYSQINSFIGTPVTVPVYDSWASGKYHLSGFAKMKIVAHTPNPPSTYDQYSTSINVMFENFEVPNGSGGCNDYGGSVEGPPPGPAPTVGANTPPPPVGRVLIGQVKFNKLTPVSGITQSQTHVPIDVVQLLDISGSMSDSVGSSTKIAGAKTALTTFNGKLQTTDQVGLVTFPNITTGTSYKYTTNSNSPCTLNSSNYTNYYFGQVRNTLTNVTTTVNSTINGLSANGGTPLADGIRLAAQTVVGTNHQSSHPAVMIVASDGIANIRLNGQWTGFAGTTYSSVYCNSPAEQDAIDQANIAKATITGAGTPITIFTIAIGTDFNPAVLQAIASPDTNPSYPHFFQVTDAGTQMTTIYNQIANRVENISNESCSVIQSETLASGATVIIKNLSTGNSYTLTTNSAGTFFLQNADAGTYQVMSATVTLSGFTYNVFTDGVGGPTLGSNPTVTVPIGSGTTKTDIALATTQAATCQ